MRSTHCELRSAARINPKDEYISLIADESQDNGPALRALKQCLRLAINNDLTDTQRRILLMYYRDGIGMPAIAEELGMNKSSVCRSLDRSRRRLQELLKYSVMLINHPEE